MAGIKSLIALALTGSVGMTLLILACTLHQQNWWPAIVTLFYLAVPLPIIISRQFTSDSTGFSGPSDAPKEWAYFLTTGIVISALALPIVMNRTDTIQTSATVLSLASSSLFFSTILAFFLVFQGEDNYSSGMY